MTLDPVSIGGAIASLKNIVDLVKNANDAQLSLKVSKEFMEVQGQLFDFQQKALAVQQRNYDLEGELRRYKSFVFHHSVYWHSPPDKPEDGPFCPICFGEDREMRLILRGPHVDSERLIFACVKSHVENPGKRAEMGATTEPRYNIPKELIPADRYSPR